jgi:hypothetical protein
MTTRTLKRLTFAQLARLEPRLRRLLRQVKAERQRAKWNKDYCRFEPNGKELVLVKEFVLPSSLCHLTRWRWQRRVQYEHENV